MKKLPYILLTLLVTQVLAPPLPAGSEGYHPPVAETFPDLLMPVNLRHLNIRNPSVTAIVRIGTDGEILDHVVISASHAQLIGPAERALKFARFQPAHDETGTLVADLNLEVHFRDPGREIAGTIAMSVTDHIDENIQGLAHTQPAMQMSLPDELDKPLSVSGDGEILVPVDADDQPVKGRAVIELYVDAQGIPRLPKILVSDHPAITKAALHRIEGLRFEPPTRNGLPTVVKARLPFNFD
ncbi:hypothetical protein G0Q06_13200 [Puniceicoccales bacterium CK1056]|uniref:TonB C-terminal domain-containing protein n=1 Tax=Oceanipulchritudo coccoides TaxID=2706888 RepID=A0A6B2M4Y1_9BACT|nr:energy transducer TonB [Oceanipulchritudo coccoides]NDV63416.1 hypothetical protein [Oceanipulchritudo coccoides]